MTTNNFFKLPYESFIKAKGNDWLQSVWANTTTQVPIEDLMLLEKNNALGYLSPISFLNNLEIYQITKCSLNRKIIETLINNVKINRCEILTATLDQKPIRIKFEEHIVLGGTPVQFIYYLNPHKEEQELLELFGEGVEPIMDQILISFFQEVKRTFDEETSFSKGNVVSLFGE
ncbi:hypothetical protein [Metabacillus indicus]|uniref:hypothetical protein n=1 Tax=Metabacillus indicus TaxID=246786 RepID=UPI003CF09D15